MFRDEEEVHVLKSGTKTSRIDGKIADNNKKAEIQDIAFSQFIPPIRYSKKNV